MSSQHDQLGNISGIGIDSGILASPYYLDLNFGPSAFTVGPIAPDRIQVDPANTTNIYTYGFDGNNSTELVYGGEELQHDYKEGSIIVPHLHWMSTTTNSGNVKWFVELYFKEGNDIKLNVIDSAIQAVTGTAWEEQRLDFSEINIPSLKIGTQLFFAVWRNPTDDDDTYGDDAALGATFGFHYKVDAAGSRQITSKY